MTSKRILIFNYHRILSPKAEKSSTLLFDDTLFGPTQDEFERQISFLKVNADIIDEKALYDHYYHGLRLPKRSILITFDDGYRDNFDLAFPVLQHHQASAIFFIPIDKINHRKVCWWDQLSYIAKKLGRPDLGPKWISHYRDLKADVASDFLKTLQGKYTGHLPSDLEQDEQIMTWDQIKTLSQCGMSIGSHTVSHSILSKQTPENQELELQKSLSALNQKLGYQIKSLAYPVGEPWTYTQKTQELALKTGYKLAFSFLTGVNFEKNDPFNIKRIHPPSHLYKLMFWTHAPKIFVNQATTWKMPQITQ